MSAFKKILQYIIVALLLIAAIAGGITLAGDPAYEPAEPIEKPGITVVTQTPGPSPVSGSLTPQPGEMMAKFIDVGKGDSVLIALPTGEVMLVDAAEEEDAGYVTAALDMHGVEEIDYLVLTHPHSDHIGGAQRVINGYTVNNVIMPEAVHTTGEFKDTAQLIADRGINAIEGEAGLRLALGEAELTFVSPIRQYEEINDNSLAFILEYGDTRMLMCGDMETPAENDVLDIGCDLGADIIKVAHHGSDSSSSKEWIEAVTPAYAIISCEGPSNNTPSREVLQRYADMGAAVISTHESGDIYVFAGKEDYRVVKAGNPHER